jgi:trigger factor
MALVEGCKHELEITIPAAEVDKEIEKVATKIQARAHLPGFRPGKAPLSMIRSRFGGEIRQEALESLLPKHFRKMADAEKLDVVGTPSVTPLAFEPGQDVKFKAEFEVAPEFELGEYRGVTVPYAQPEVADADVDARLEEIREQKAEYINLDPRPAESGDVALVDVHSSGQWEGEPFHAHDMQIELGSAKTLPGFTEALTGMSPGEEKHINVTYPEDHAQEHLAGKTVEFHVHFKTLQRKELPELNDEFAKDLGDFQSLGELTDAIRRNVMHERETQAQRSAKDAIADKLADMHPFPVPEAYLDRQVQMYVDNLMSDQAARGVDVKKLNFDMARLKEAMRDRATRQVRASLLLDKIASREAIGATQDEVDGEVQRYAKQHREPVAAVRKRFEENGTMARIANVIRNEKILNFLFEHARKEAPSETPVETPAQSKEE